LCPLGNGPSVNHRWHAERAPTTGSCGIRAKNAPRFRSPSNKEGRRHGPRFARSSQPHQKSTLRELTTATTESQGELLLADLARLHALRLIEDRGGKWCLTDLGKVRLASDRQAAA
jgi:hypothetical protein